jgi:putative phosphonate metabolism protein
MPDARYALFFAPPQGSELETLCAKILGRCAHTGQSLPQPRLAHVPCARLAELTASPRHYGLHGTLKPPFALAPGRSENELIDAVLQLAARTSPFTLPGLELNSIGSFLALTLTAPCQTLDDLAGICVIAMDTFRRPATPQELARRRAKGLNVNQDRLLQLYGYPYVLEEFRFHLTLTGSIHEPEELERVRAGLSSLLAPILHKPVPVQDICLFRQSAAEEPFIILGRYPLLATPK